MRGLRYQDHLCDNAESVCKLAHGVAPRCHNRATRLFSVRYIDGASHRYDLCATCANELYYDCVKHQNQFQNYSLFREQLTDEQASRFRSSEFRCRTLLVDMKRALDAIIINSSEFKQLVEFSAAKLIAAFSDDDVVCEKPTRAQVRQLIEDLFIE